MNVIKEKRQELGFTQTELAKQSGLSLRTIQRLEKANKPPKGFTLTALSEVFDLEPVDLSSAYHVDSISDDDLASELLLINLSTFGFFLLPFGNVIIPLILWRKRKSIKQVDEGGRRIINFQILWSLCMSLAMIITPFFPIKIIFGFSPIFVVLFAAIIINFTVVVASARKIRNHTFDFLDFSIRIM